MNRRKFISKVSLALGGIAVLGKTAFSTTLDKVTPGLTIAQILHVAYPAVLNEMRHGRNWSDPALHRMECSGQIRQIPYLGVMIEVPRWDGSSDLYPVEQLHIPVVWSKNDELRNPRESQKIELVRHLLENVINSHDDYLINKIGDNKMVYSKDWIYCRGETMEIPNAHAYMVKIYSVLAILPL